MAIEDLVPIGESRIAEVNDNDGTTFILTDKRVIRARKGFTTESVDDLLLTHISSFGRVWKRYIWLALLAPFVYVVAFPFLCLNAALKPEQPDVALLVVLTIVAVTLLVLGLVLKDRYYEFKASGLTGDDQKKWRIRNVALVERTQFASLVRRAIAGGSLSAPGQGASPPAEPAAAARPVGEVQVPRSVAGDTQLDVRFAGRDRSISVEGLACDVRDGRLGRDAYVRCPPLFGDEMWHRLDQSILWTAVQASPPDQGPKAVESSSTPVPVLSPPATAPRLKRISLAWYLISVVGAQLGGVVLAADAYFSRGLYNTPIPLIGVLDLSIALELLGAAALLTFSEIFYLVALFKLWDAIQGPYARTTPAKAIGFMFIPIYSLFWTFPVHWGFARDFNKLRDSLDEVSRVHLRRLPEGIFMVFSIVQVATQLLLLVPVAGGILLGMVIVLTAVFFSVSIPAVNRLAELRARQGQSGTARKTVS